MPTPVLLFERVVRRMPWLVVLVKVLLVRMLLKLFAIYMPSPALLDPMLLVRILSHRVTIFSIKASPAQAHASASSLTMSS